MIRPITIEAVLNGFKCRVGCQEVVFETTEGMMQHLYRYLQHPEKTEQEFLSSPAAFNARHTMNGGAAQAAPDVHYRRPPFAEGLGVAASTSPVPTYRGDGIEAGNAPNTGRY